MPASARAAWACCRCPGGIRVALFMPFWTAWFRGPSVELRAQPSQPVRQPGDGAQGRWSRPLRPRKWVPNQRAAKDNRLIDSNKKHKLPTKLVPFYTPSPLLLMRLRETKETGGGFVLKLVRDKVLSDFFGGFVLSKTPKTAPLKIGQ